MANRFLNNIKINDAYTLPSTVGTTGQYIKLTDAGTGATAWSDLGQAAEVSTISYEVRNETGSSIPVGSVVYVNGGSGSSDHVTIALSDASSESTSSKTFAVTAETIANNSTGKVILEGIVEGVDTSLFSPGDTLWLSTTAGEFDNSIPTTPDHAVFIGYAVRCQQNNGSIFVKIQNGYELGEIHDIKITSVANNDLIVYDSTLGYWVNSNDLTLSGLHVDSTGAVEMPAGTTAERPTGVAGMFRFNSEDSQFEGYNGTEWGAIAGGGGTTGQGLSIERDVFTATANQTAFVISSAITASSNTQVYIDGVYQSKDNYTTNGSTVTFNTGVPLGAEVEVVHFISVFSKIYTDTFTGDASKVNFTASKDVTDENVTQIYIDGVYQSKDNYTTSGTTITFSTAPPNGSAIEVVHFTALDYSTIASNQFTGTGSQTNFTLTQEVDVDKAFVFIQGVYQEKSTYSISGTTLSFTTAPLSGYTIEVITIGAVSVLTDTLYVDTFTGTGSQVDYTLSSSPASVNAIDVYLNGIYQNKSNFSVSGSTLTFSTAPTAGTAIEVKSTGGLNNVVSSGSGGGISWQATPKTANFTAVAGQGYFVNTTSSAIIVTLPSSPSAGDEVTIVDYAGTADTNKITITSSDNINGSADDAIINYERGGASMVYVDSTQGWIAYNAANETASALKVPLPLTVDYLVIAGGGGGGGTQNAGGGGAGGYRNSYNNETSGGGASSETSLILNTSQSYTVTVGAGGAGGASATNGTDGFNSVFTTITSNGGGGGGAANGNGNNGGSGGGQGYQGSSVGAGTTSQGYNGGTGVAASSNYGAGGGGGAGGLGQNGTGSATGNGGAGLSSSITGSAVTRASGGSGGSNTINPSATPGGGSTSASNATDNTGGGGGGASNLPSTQTTGRNGGSGIVILRYPDVYTVTIGSGLTGSTTTDGSNKVTTFTAGTGTISFS